MTSHSRHPSIPHTLERPAPFFPSSVSQLAVHDSADACHGHGWMDGSDRTRGDITDASGRIDPIHSQWLTDSLTAFRKAVCFSCVCVWVWVWGVCGMGAFRACLWRHTHAYTHTHHLISSPLTRCIPACMLTCFTHMDGWMDGWTRFVQAAVTRCDGMRCDAMGCDAMRCKELSLFPAPSLPPSVPVRVCVCVLHAVVWCRVFKGLVFAAWLAGCLAGWWPTFFTNGQDIGC